MGQLPVTLNPHLNILLQSHQQGPGDRPGREPHAEINLTVKSTWLLVSDPQGSDDLPILPSTETSQHTEKKNNVIK